MVILDNKERKIITAGLLVKLYLNPHSRSSIKNTDEVEKNYYYTYCSNLAN